MVFYILMSNCTPKQIKIFGLICGGLDIVCVNIFSFKLNFTQFFFSFCEIYAYIFSISAQVCSDPMIFFENFLPHSQCPLCPPTQHLVIHLIGHTICLRTGMVTFSFCSVGILVHLNHPHSHSLELVILFALYFGFQGWCRFYFGHLSLSFVMAILVDLCHLLSCGKECLFLLWSNIPN